MSLAYRLPDEEDATITALLRESARGSHAAFNEIASRWRDLVVRAARTVLRSWEDAEDAAQDALVCLWQWIQGKEWVTDHGGAGLLVKFARQCAWNMIQHRHTKGRDGRGKEDEARAALHDLHVYKKGGALRESTPREPYHDPLRKLGLVNTLLGEVPPHYLSLLDRFFYKFQTIEEMAAADGLQKVEINRALQSGVEVIRHLAKAA